MAGQLRVLVVEDEASMRLLIERVLSRAGLEVVAVEDVEHAMAWIDSVDVIVADYFLRNDRGSRLARDARSELGIFCPPILLVTATPQAVRPEERPLFADQLAKPFQVATLVERVRALVRDRRRARSGTELKAVATDASTPGADGERGTG